MQSHQQNEAYLALVLSANKLKTARRPRAPFGQYLKLSWWHTCGDATGSTTPTDIR
jgi:hypothetical protein